METTLDTLEAVYDRFNHNFQGGFNNLLWQLMINDNWQGRNLHCFTPVYDQNGLTIGISEDGVSGYSPTRVYFKPGIMYNEACEILIQINEAVFGHNENTCEQIILSSMRKR